MPDPRRIAASHVTPDRTTPKSDGLAAIRQRAQFGPFVVPGPDVQLQAETLATLLDDVERLLAIAEAASELDFAHLRGAAMLPNIVRNEWRHADRNDPLTRLETLVGELDDAPQ